uniref:Transposase n=1 Tax=Heterorhabditis bacteriophora TaxID=37862 RepID=A0A1I7WKN1_HETBA
MSRRLQPISKIVGKKVDQKVLISSAKILTRYVDQTQYYRSAHVFFLVIGIVGKNPISSAKKS